jgi:dTDP-4-amino-4,6-dideoxygalactose transaminase
VTASRLRSRARRPKSSEPIPWIDLRRQYESVKGEVDAAVMRVLESVRYVSGPEADAFEREWAAYCGRAHAVGVGSGTAALNLTLKALGVGPGDEVITGGFILSAVLDAISELGARPVLVDVNPETYTLDPSQLAPALSGRTRAVLAVHVYGHPADIDPIAAVCEQHALPLVLDACEAHGARYRGAQAAAYGTASCFSFYPTKNLGGIGDAGAVVTDDAELAARVRRLRQHGWDRRYHSLEPSLNSRMDEVQAAVLRAKLPHLERWNQRRRAIARRFDAALEGTGVIAAPHAAWAEPSYYFYVVRTAERDRFRQGLQEAGIATDVSWPEPPHLQPGYHHLGYERGSLPVTERLCDEVVTVPMFPELREEEIERICRALHHSAKAMRAAT